MRLRDTRPASFWPLAIFFALFVLFMYGPMFVIFILSFQGPEGGLTFPMRGVSLHWFHKLAEGLGTVDIGAAFRRSLMLGAVVMAFTVVLSVLAGLAFRKKLAGGNALFYVTVASLIMPSVVVSLGIGSLLEVARARLEQQGALKGRVELRLGDMLDPALGSFDYVVAMDGSNYRNLERLAPDAAGRAKISMLRLYETTEELRVGRAAHDHEEVPDPYYGGADGFDRVLDICEVACAALLAHVQTKHALT